LPECVLPVDTVDAEGVTSLVRLLNGLGVDRLNVVADGGDDTLTLDGNPLPATIDEALRIEELRFGSGVVTKDAVGDLVRMFDRNRLADLHPVLGGAPKQILKRGEYTVVILDTAGDPTVPSDVVRTWEIGLAGKDPIRNVPAVGGAGNVYSGVQHVLTYAQVPGEGGGFEGRLGHTDFGSDKLGPDGQTPFYNGRTNFAALAYGDGVIFIFPADLDPVGFRAWARGGDPAVWDIVQGPGGPVALVPPDGSWPGILTAFLPSVVHDPITLPATINDRAMPDVEFPSHLDIILGVPLVDPDQPLTIDLGYRTGDTSVRFDDLLAQPLGDGLFGTQIGLTRFGLHAFEEFLIEELGDLPEGWDLLSEEARMFAWALFMVGEEEGPIHGNLVRPWVAGEGDAARHSYDPDGLLHLVDDLRWSDGAP
jgi:hypothetical protein